MTNFEKYKDDEALKSTSFGLEEGKLIHCDYNGCKGCDFLGTNCGKSRMNWLKAEYEEPRINLPKDLPVDAKIEVSDDGEVWKNRHFAGFKDGKVLTWHNGGTSWTTQIRWNYKYARLPKENEADDSKRN